MSTMKFAVTPGFEVGGTMFTPGQLAVLGSAVGDGSRIEMTTFKQLYVEMEEERAEEAKAKLRQAGLEAPSPLKIGYSAARWRPESRCSKISGS